MLTKQQLRILAVFHKHVFDSFTFKQIKEMSKQTSNNVTQTALTEFRKQGLVKTQIIGNVTIYQLNLNNGLTLAYLNIINELDVAKRKFPKEILAEIKKRVFKQTEFFVLMVFGSYAKNKTAQNSDLDIALIVESEPTRKEVIPLLETVKRREIKPIDYHVFTREEFLEMLNTDYENIGKQIYKNNLIYYGFIEYYNLTWSKKNE